MIKLEVNTVHDQISVKSNIEATRGDVVNEIYAMMKHLETNYPSELTRAIKLLCIEHQEEMDG